MTSMRRRYVALTSLRRHVPAGNLAPPLGPPPQYSKPWPPQYSKPSYTYDMVCSIWGSRTTNMIKIMILGWYWPILWQSQNWSLRLWMGTAIVLSDVEVHCNSMPLKFLRSRSFIDLGLGSLVCPLSTFSKGFSSETTWPISVNFICSLLAKGETNYIFGPGHMTKMATIPRYGKNLKNILHANICNRITV